MFAVNFSNTVICSIVEILTLLPWAGPQQSVCRLGFVYGLLHNYIKVSCWLDHGKYEQIVWRAVQRRIEFYSSHQLVTQNH